VNEPITLPKPGDFGLVRITGTAGALIRVGQYLNAVKFRTVFSRDLWRNVQHAFVVVDDDMVVEAEPGGARRVPLTEYATESVIWSSWPLSDDERKLIVAQAMNLIGTPYSFLDYLSLTARRLHIPVPGLRRYIADTGHMICSQLTDEAYRRAKLNMFQDGRWAGDVDPLDLYPVRTGPLIAAA
jgi:hypothetical protein